MTKSKKQKSSIVFTNTLTIVSRDIGIPGFDIPFFALRASARQLRKVDASKNSVKKRETQQNIPRGEIYAGDIVADR